MQDILDSRTPVSGSAAPRPPLLKALTSVRFFMALHVALYHLVRPFSLWGFARPFFQVGFVGVSFFFFLSGYILTYSHAAEYEAGRGDAKRFWFARFARIYPVYLVSLLAAGWLGRQEFHHPLHGLAYLADVVLVQSWSMRLVNFFHITAWSLSVEAFFYLVFPFLLLKLRPHTALSAWLWVGGFWLLAMVAPSICVHAYPLAAGPGGLYSGAPGSLMLARVERLPLLALPEFLAGVSLGWLFLRFPPRAAWAPWCVLAGVLGSVSALMCSNVLPDVMLHNGLLIPFDALIILGLSVPNRISRLLSASWLVLLGEASFSIYLIHVLFDKWATSHFGYHATIATALLKLGCILPLSIALYLWIERPCRRWLLNRRQHRAAGWKVQPR